MKDDILGKEFERRDSSKKVTGKARYTADFTSPDLLYTALVKSTVAHANIKSINVDKAKLSKGNIKDAFEKCDVIVEETFNIPQSDHVAMETRSCIVEIIDDKEVIIETSSQAPFTVQSDISSVFGIDINKITVKVPFVGGGFGGKVGTNVEFIGYLASKSVYGKRVGGNLCGNINFKEVILPLMLSDAKLSIATENGINIIDLNSSYTNKINLNRGEFIVNCIIEKNFNNHKNISLRTTKGAQIDYPLISIASMYVDNEIRIAFSGLCKFPFRSIEVEIMYTFEEYKYESI